MNCDNLYLQKALVITDVDKLGETFKKRRKELGMSQFNVALEADVPVATICNIEKHGKIPVIPVLLRCATALGYDRVIFDLL